MKDKQKEVTVLTSGLVELAASGERTPTATSSVLGSKALHAAFDFNAAARATDYYQVSNSPSPENMTSQRIRKTSNHPQQKTYSPNSHLC
ncbi:MAG: hypothetical protein WCB53_19830 [Terriglobales bacterium]